MTTTEDRAAMRERTDAAWWRRPVVWTGIRNDLERRAIGFEAAASYFRENEGQATTSRAEAERCRRLAELAFQEYMKGNR